LFNSVFQLIDEDGAVVRGSPVSGVPVSDEDIEVARRERESHRSDIEVEDLSLRVLTIPTGQSGAAMLVESLESVDDTLERLRRTLFVLGSLGVLVAGLAGFAVARRSLRPVGRLTEAAAHVAETQDLEAAISVDRSDELGDLAGSFNDMLAALARSRDQQHQLVTDASHELRTPLTSLRTNIEHLTRAPDLDEQQRAEVLDDVLFELDELTDLVSELVDLATDRREFGEPEPVELGPLVQAVVERHRRRTDVALELTSDDTVVIGQPAFIERAVSNLIDNAVKWSPADGRVEVTAVDGRITVRDHGPGIDPDDRELVFDRFWRTDAARAMPGSGLGLSIVRQVADAHGGRAWAEAPDDGVGASVVLELPCAEETSDALAGSSH
jgi:two-component system sensor histidine kinase MprB